MRRCRHMISDPHCADIANTAKCHQTLAILWWFSSKPRPRGQVSALFLIGYGVLRFIAEFAREPDAFLGYLALGMTMGQWLCVPMIALGVWLFAWSRRSTHS